MKTLFKTLLIGIALFAFCFSNAQEVRFTQMLNHPLQLNPALMSSSNDFRLTLGHRAQWQLIENGYQTEAFSAMFPVFLKKDSWKDNRGSARLDIGLSATNDRVGAFNNVNPILAVSSGLKISKNQFVSIALYGGYLYKMLDVDGLTFDEQYINGSYNPDNPNGELLINETVGTPDVGFGMAWFYVPLKDAKFHAYAGISGFHMNEFNASYLELTGKVHTRYSFQAGVKVIPEDWVDVTTHTGYITHGGFEQFYLGVLAGMYVDGKSKIVFGSWFKQKEAVAMQIGFHHNSFMMDLSYDFPYTDINRSIRNLTTWELNVGYRFNRVKSKGYTNASFF